MKTTKKIPVLLAPRIPSEAAKRVNETARLLTEAERAHAKRAEGPKWDGSGEWP